MRAWMLLLGFVVGCGTSTSPDVANVMGSRGEGAVKEAAIPREVAPLLEKGAFAQAVEALTAMIEKSPRDDALFSLRASANHRLGQNGLAIADMDQAILLNPRDARLYNNRGFMRLALEQYQPAQADFDKAIELAPAYKNALNNRGLLQVAQSRFDEAILEFNRALEIDDRYLDAYNNRGFAELQLGQIAKALTDFNVVIDLDPNYVNGYTNRGLLRAEAGDYENAAIDFTQAMMLDPLNPKYYVHRRDIYRKQGEYRKAIEDEKKILWLEEYHLLTAEIAASRRPVEELIERAEHFFRVQNYEKALEDLNRALEFDGQSARALVVRAGVHLKRKALRDAQTDAEAALAVLPTDEAHSILGEILLELGDYDRAIENFVRARRTDETVAEAHYGKAKKLEAEGQLDKAKSSLDQALALDPDIEARLR
jgi:tetratricopeptide (TPR) repeat protein